MTELAVGQRLPPLTLPPLSRTTLALFAGASGDPNPIHIDLDFARKAGLPDVFGHGMLTMAYLGRLLVRWVPQHRLRSFSVRFVGLTQLQHQLTCSGTVVELLEQAGERVARVELQVTNQYGESKLQGEALVAL